VIFDLRVLVLEAYYFLTFFFLCMITSLHLNQFIHFLFTDFSIHYTLPGHRILDEFIEEAFEQK
jgi:hypothetical protein